MAEASLEAVGEVARAVPTRQAADFLDAVQAVREQRFRSHDAGVNE